jgi:hypothetical protein
MATLDADSYESIAQIEGGVSRDTKDTGNYIGGDTDGTFVATRYGVTFDWWYRNVKGKTGTPTGNEVNTLKTEFKNSINNKDQAFKAFKTAYFDKPTAGNLSLKDIKDEASAHFILDSMINQNFSFNDTSSKNIYEAIEKSGGKNTGNIINDLNAIDQQTFRQEFLKVRADRYSNSKTFDTHGKGWMKRLDDLESSWSGKGFETIENKDFSFQNFVKDQEKGNYSLDLSTPEKSEKLSTGMMVDVGGPEMPAQLSRSNDGKLVFTDDDGNVKEFKSLAEFQNFQESQKKDTSFATDTKDLPLDMESIKAEYEKQNQPTPFKDVIGGVFKTLTGIQGGGFNVAISGIKDLLNTSTALPNFDDLTNKQKEDFIISLAEEKIRTGDADGSGQKMLDLIQKNRQEQKEIDFDKGLIRNSETGEVVDNMANVVERDITTVQDKTDVDLGEKSNILDDSGTQPIEKLTKDKDILNVLDSDSDEKTNPFKTDDVDIKDDDTFEYEDPLEDQDDNLEEDEEVEILDTKKKTKVDDKKEDKERRRNLDVLASAAIGLVSGGLGVRQMNKALEDIPVEEGPKLNAAWQAHMSKMRELAQSGLTAEEKASAQADLSKNYNLGVRNVMRAAGGSRAAFLANAGVLNANRVEGLLKLSAMDAAMQRKNMDAYGKQLQFENEFGRKTGEIDRKMAYDEATRKSALHGEIGNALIETALDNVNYAITKQTQAPMLDRYQKFFEQQNLSQDLNTFGESLERTQLNTEN